MTTGMIVLVLFGLLIVGTIVSYNGIISRFNAVDRAWASVLSQERQKNNIIPHIEKLVAGYQGHENEVLTRVTALRQTLGQMGSEIDADALSRAEQQTAHVLQGLQMTVEAYPDLKASEVYMSLMAEISEQQEQIGAAIRIFNANVEDFNNAIETFPGVLVNNVLAHKRRIHSFTDAQAQTEFDYQPNM
ncbi:membrane protein [Shewanella sp. NFH-SH190041]|uniref:LemA family protein n=1 Tax=Shewanella sp. NFH-SH190041 TaxID=2950245 RepID=UPI0021C4A33C|nr:LemA family protein [Shewanella sp. NFH-SH190041]BDM63144.1 membrane protein [Shewanella sp. NFH-SH190041]